MLGHVALPFALLLSATDAEPAFKVITADVKRIEAVLSYEVKTTRYAAEEWIYFAARAPQVPGQTQVSTRLEPAGVALEEFSSEHRSVLRGRLAAHGKALQTGFGARVIYLTTLRSRDLVPIEAGERYRPMAPLPSDMRKLYLATSQALDFKSPEFQQWLDRHSLRRRRGERDLDFARRAFLQISKAFTYQWPVPHAGTASSTCKAGRGDCGCMSAVFVSALRQSGVPARALVGRWAQSLTPGKKTGDEPDYQTHVKAEFFADGIGWVPVDQTQALGDRSPLRFFGHDPGDFVVQHVDFDLILDTIHFGRERVNVMQGIPYWTKGSGSLEKTKTHENWQVRTLRAK